MELRGGSWPDQVQLASHTLAADRYSRAARSRASGSVAARGWATGYRAGPAGVCKPKDATLTGCWTAAHLVLVEGEGTAGGGGRAGRGRGLGWDWSRDLGRRGGQPSQPQSAVERGLLLLQRLQILHGVSHCKVNP